jgi:hypothetical protein
MTNFTSQNLSEKENPKLLKAKSHQPKEPLPLDLDYNNPFKGFEEEPIVEK